MQKRLLFLLVPGLLLIGCSQEKLQNVKISNKNIERSQKIFSFKDVDRKDTYQGLSDIGIDYTFPVLNDNWSVWKNLGEDCKVSKNSKDTSKIFIIRDVEFKDIASEDFLKKLNGKDIKSYLEKQIATYIGKTDETEGELNYINKIKFYNVDGHVEHEQKQYLYRVVYFQSNLFQPSVFRKYVPTAFFILYEDGKDEEDVLGMLEVFKNNLIYQN